MSSKYQCKRFQRNHQNITLPINQKIGSLPEKTQNTSISSISFQKSSDNICPKRQYEFNQTLNFVQRLNKIQSFIQLQKNQRLHDYNRLMKMIKQMQCKHSSIIYNSEIKYCKSPPKPQIFHSFTGQNLMRKFSSTYNLIGKGKQNGYIQAAKILKNNHIQVQNQIRNSTTDADNQSEQRCNAKQNPEKVQSNIIIKVDQKQLKQKYEQMELKISESMMQQIEKVKEQIKSINSEQINQINDYIKMNNQIQEKQIHNLIINQQSYSDLIDLFKQKLFQNQSKLLGELERILNKVQEYEISQSTNIQQYVRRFQYLEDRMNYFANKCEQIEKKMENQEGKLCLLEQQLNQKDSKQENKSILNQIKERIQKIQRSPVQSSNINNNTNNNFESKQKQIEKYVKSFSEMMTKQINDVKLSSQNNLVTMLNQINNKTKDLERNLHNLEQKIQSRLEHLSSTVNNQSKQIINVQSNNQSISNLYSNKIHEVLQVMNNKFSNIQKDRQMIIEMERSQKLKQMNQEAQKQKQRQIIYKKIEQKLNSKTQVLKIACSKQIQHRYEKSQTEIEKIIQKHICFVQNFVQKIIQKEQIIVRKFMRDNDSTQASLTPRKF